MSGFDFSDSNSRIGRMTALCKVLVCGVSSGAGSGRFGIWWARNARRCPFPNGSAELFPAPYRRHRNSALHSIYLAGASSIAILCSMLSKSRRVRLALCQETWRCSRHSKLQDHPFNLKPRCNSGLEASFLLNLSLLARLSLLLSAWNSRTSLCWLNFRDPKERRSSPTLLLSPAYHSDIAA